MDDYVILQNNVLSQIFNHTKYIKIYKIYELN